MSGNKVPFPETKEWFKIEHSNGVMWNHSLYRGAPSAFTSLDEAKTVVARTSEYPILPTTPNYRIVKVTEEVVHES